jgi:putative phosphoesterase
MRASDLIVHAGDFTSERVLNALQQLGPPVAAVHGNVDEEALQRALPAVREVDAGGARIAIVHDAGPAPGRLERMRARFPKADAVVFGHSHIPLQEERDDFQIFNPGSPTDRRRQPRFTMGIGEVEGGRIRFRVVPLD